VFFALAMRLPAYTGALAAVAARQAREGTGGGSAPQRSAPRYERNSASANNARTAESAPAATGQAISMLNAQLGGGWFSYRHLKADGK
jgi:hypothetical protein